VSHGPEGLSSIITLNAVTLPFFAVKLPRLNGTRKRGSLALPTRMAGNDNPGNKLDRCFRVRLARVRDVAGTISLAAISNLQASKDERLVSFAVSQQAA
jgi:hypothetical protein